MSAKSIFSRIKHRYGSSIVQIDVSKPSPLTAELLNLSGIDTAKISRKNNPTFLVKSDEMLTKMSPDLFNKHFNDMFEEKFHKLSVQQKIGSVKDLAEKLRQFNRELDDCTFVYCEGPNPESYENKAALRLI